MAAAHTSSSKTDTNPHSLSLLVCVPLHVYQRLIARPVQALTGATSGGGGTVDIQSSHHDIDTAQLPPIIQRLTHRFPARVREAALAILSALVETHTDDDDRRTNDGDAAQPSSSRRSSSKFHLHADGSYSFGKARYGQFEPVLREILGIALHRHDAVDLSLDATRLLHVLASATRVSPDEILNPIARQTFGAMQRRQTSPDRPPRAHHYSPKHTQDTPPTAE